MVCVCVCVLLPWDSALLLSQDFVVLRQSCALNMSTSGLLAVDFDGKLTLLSAEAKALSQVRLSDVGLRHIRVLSQLKALTDLNLSFNAISNLTPLTGLTALTSVDVSHKLYHTSLCSTLKFIYLFMLVEKVPLRLGLRLIRFFDPQNIFTVSFSFIYLINTFNKLILLYYPLRRMYVDCCFGDTRLS